MHLLINSSVLVIGTTSVTMLVVEGHHFPVCPIVVYHSPVVLGLLTSQITSNREAEKETPTVMAAVAQMGFICRTDEMLLEYVLFGSAKGIASDRELSLAKLKVGMVGSQFEYELPTHPSSTGLMPRGSINIKNDQVPE